MIDKRDRARLLTLGNPKIVKGTKKGWLTAVLHLAPAKLSGYNVCSHATTGCAIACLNTAGRGGIIKKGFRTNNIQRARKRKTRAFFEQRDAFLEVLVHSIGRHVRRAARLGLVPAIRLNGTSDLPWERIRHTAGWTVPERFPTLQFYDYTKVPGRKLPANYHLTFSLAESNDLLAQQELRAGRNVAVVFRTKQLPQEFMGRRVINGDENDLRFLDPVNVVVGLSAKGKGKRDTSGFVRAA